VHALQRGLGDEDGVVAFSLGLTSNRLAETQPKFHPPRYDQLPSRTALTPSNLAMYDPAPYYGPSNLVLSPNSTPPQNTLPCNTKEGTSTLGANRRTSRRNENRSGAKGNTGLLPRNSRTPVGAIRSIYVNPSSLSGTVFSIIPVSPCRRLCLSVCPFVF
jgi:hypothetical protein